MKLILKILAGTVSVLVSAYIIPGVEVESVMVALIVAIVLGVLNTFIKPILILLTLPITLLTLGLFTFVINTFLVVLADSLVEGFTVSTILIAFVFSIVVSLVNSFLNKMVD